MPKPVTTYTWDTNATNVSQPSAGLRSDGYATDDIPTSANWNYQMNSVYQWLSYLETTTDALDTIQGAGDINIICDNDGTSTANSINFKHNAAGDVLAKIDESANFLLNQATVGTNGAGVLALKTGTDPTTQPADEIQLYSSDFAAGDARLYVKTESGGTISIGNNAIRNANSDGTLLVTSEKHVTVDIDSDNDGTDGLFTVRANGTTAALTVSEAGAVVATGAITGTNLLSTNVTDQTALAASALLTRATDFTLFTDAEVLTTTLSTGNYLRAATGATAKVILAIGTNQDIVTAPVAANEIIAAGVAWTSVSLAVNYTAVDADGTFGVGVAAAGALYTSPASGDYATWTSRTSGTAQNLGYVSVGGGYWCAYSNANANVIRYNDTTDPTDAWSGSTSGLDGTTTFAGAAYGAGLHVAITTDHEIITTANPSGAWTLRTNPTTATWRGMSFDGTCFWAWGDSGKLITSTDGITWSDVSLSGGGTMRGACSVGTGSLRVYLAYDSTVGTLYYGTTLGTWTVLPVDVVTSTPTTPIVYEPAIKRLFWTSSNDLMYSKKIV